MSDAVALTNYLRDYIWSIGINQMRNAGAGPESPAPQPQPTSPPVPVQTGDRAPAPSVRSARAGSR